MKGVLEKIEKCMEIEGGLRRMRGVMEYVENGDEEDVMFGDIRVGDGDVLEGLLEIGGSCGVIFRRGYNEYGLEGLKRNGMG